MPPQNGYSKWSMPHHTKQGSILKGGAHHDAQGADGGGPHGQGARGVPCAGGDDLLRVGHLPPRPPLRLQRQQVRMLAACADSKRICRGESCGPWQTNSRKQLSPEKRNASAERRDDARAAAKQRQTRASRDDCGVVCITMLLCLLLCVAQLRQHFHALPPQGLGKGASPLPRDRPTLPPQHSGTWCLVRVRRTVLAQHILRFAFDTAVCRRVSRLRAACCVLRVAFSSFTLLAPCFAPVWHRRPSRT